MNKKFLSLLVSLIFMFNIFGTGVAMAGTSNGKTTVTIQNDGSVTVTMEFKDLKSALWALKDISKMQVQDVIKGYNDGTFRPNQPIKRVEAVTMAIRLMGLEDQANDQATVQDSVYDSVYGSVYNQLPFADSGQIGDWAKGYMRLALEHQLIEANDGNFQPNKPATRLWTAVLLTKALGLESEAEAQQGATLDFKDANLVPAELAGYVAVAVDKGLVQGFPDHTFKPNKPVTRAEMAALLGRTDDQIQVDNNPVKARGTVQAVDLEASTITLDQGGTYAVAPNAQIFVGDDLSTLADVTVGARVNLFLTQGKAVFIECKVDHEKMEQEKEREKREQEKEKELEEQNREHEKEVANQEIEGIVSAVGADVITVSAEDEEVVNAEIKVNADTKVEMEGKPGATISDIMVGDKIEARIVDGQAIMIKVETEQPHKGHGQREDD